MFNALEYMFNGRELVFKARKHNFSRHKDTSFCRFHKIIPLHPSTWQLFILLVSRKCFIWVWVNLTFPWKINWADGCPQPREGHMPAGDGLLSRASEQGERQLVRLLQFPWHGRQHHNFWNMEKAFHIAKSKIEIRPMIYFKRRRIEAHISICFIALKVYR